MLPPCPDTPNCVLETRTYSIAPDDLFRLARTAVLDIGAHDLDLDEKQRRLDAVFRVFVFQDDLTVLIEPDAAESVLHVRSASRVGRNDFGVNRRRVDRFFEALQEAVASYRPRTR